MKKNRILSSKNVSLIAIVVNFNSFVNLILPFSTKKGEHDCTPLCHICYDRSSELEIVVQAHTESESRVVSIGTNFRLDSCG